MPIQLCNRVNKNSDTVSGTILEAPKWSGLKSGAVVEEGYGYVLCHTHSSMDVVPPICLGISCKVDITGLAWFEADLIEPQIKA